MNKIKIEKDYEKHREIFQSMLEYFNRLKEIVLGITVLVFIVY